MNLDKYKDNSFEFSHSNLTVFYVRNFHLICIFVWLIVVIIGRTEIQNNFRFATFSFASFLFFLACTGFSYLKYYKHAYKIIFTEKLITLFLYRSKVPMKYKLESIENIKICFKYTFEFIDGNSIRFYDNKSREYLNFLKINGFPIK